MRVSIGFRQALPALICCALSVCSASAPCNAQCEVQKLIASDIAEADQFGDAVALSGDLAVIGASRDDDLGSASGAAYVFRYEQDPSSGVWQWTEQAKLTASDGSSNDLFGWSVGIDADAIGGPAIVVGAYYDDPGGTNSGSAYVYRYDGGAWFEEARLVASDAAAGDEFGQAVAVSGDCIVVGAARDDDGATNTGSAYVFRFNGSTWQEEAKLHAPDGLEQDQLAISVAIDGDVLIAGAAMHDHAGTSSGAAYVFAYDGLDWTFEEKLIADDATAGDKFGQSVSVSGDLALIGAYLDDDYAANAGSAYVFRYDGAWLQEAKLIASDGAADDQFGRAAAVLEDPVFGDIAVIGASLVDDAAISAGAAYVFAFDGLDWLEQAKLQASDADANDLFGNAVAAGDACILVSANKDDDDLAGVNAGSAYVFLRVSGSFEDCNNNGFPDACDIADGTSADCNANGVPDECDIASGYSFDVNANGIPDECEDCNNNGVPDFIDIAEGTSADCNDNGVPDECDIDSGTSPDINQNGIPDECETDCNNNGVPDFIDIAEGTSGDCNDNGVPDECDIDDGDSEDCNDNGIPDECDVDPLDPDGNGEVSEDCDENGVPDECEDCNENGVGDACDIANGTSLDLNGNGVPDECEDCNENGIPDFLEIAYGWVEDCNDNGVPDECDIDPLDPDGNGEISPDCNINLVPDECDVASGTSEDCDGNGVPDECDPDCNENGVPDACDIANGTSADLNNNGVPDECEDCNGNGLPDDLDISSGTSEDCNANGLPDECEIEVNSPAPGGPFFCTENCDPDCNVNGIPDWCDINVSGVSADYNNNGIPDECEPDCDGDGMPDFMELLLGLAEDCNENEIPDDCDIAAGTSLDLNGNGIPDECELGDINGDGAVDVLDLLALLSAWGECPLPPDPCPADLDANGVVDVLDLLILLANWG